MSVSQILAILLRRAWIVMLTLLSTIITVGVVLQFVPGRYEAHATASIDPGADPISDMSFRGDAITRMQGDIVSLVASQRVAMEVVKRLNWANDPQLQQDFANILLTNVEPTFDLGSNVLDIKFKSRDPNQAALIANAFLAATIDAAVAMKAAEARQTVQWFAPQLDESRKELEEALAALAAFQAKANMVAISPGGGDRETAQYIAIASELSNARAGLVTLQSRLAGGSTDLSNDPSDPNLQILAGLKEKLTTAEAEIAASRGIYGASNPKLVAQETNLATVRKQIDEATEKMHQRLKERIELAKSEIGSLEADQDRAQKSLIEVQARRDRLSQLQRNLDFRAEELNSREEAAEGAKLESKLTFSAMTVLDEAAPPVTPAFPNPFMALPVGIGTGLALGLILALLAEAADRSVRFPVDLEYSASVPFLGALERARPSRASDRRP